MIPKVCTIRKSLVNEGKYKWGGNYYNNRKCIMAVVTREVISERDLDQMVHDGNISMDEYEAIHRIDDERGIKKDIRIIKATAKRYNTRLNVVDK